MVCFRYIIVYTLHKDDNRDNDDDHHHDHDDDNNNFVTVMKLGHFLTRSVFTRSEVSAMVFPGTSCQFNV